MFTRMLVIIFLMLINTAFAEVGKITNLVGASDAFLLRGKERIQLNKGLALEVGDQLASVNAHVVFLIYPASQMSLTKKSQIKITKAIVDTAPDGKVKATSTVALVKGLVRVHVTRQENQEIEQNVVSRAVTFGVRGTEFEVAMDDKGVDLDVMKGAVEVTSPSVKTLVPEIIKANEGFRYSSELKKYMGKKFAPKFNDHPGFLNPDELKKLFKEKLESAIDFDKETDDLKTKAKNLFK